jgi:hypothetical protein
MLKSNCRAASRLVCCAAVLTLTGCTMMTPEWRPREASASDCPAYSMHYCVIDNYGKRCGCATSQSVEAIGRSR